MPEALASGSDCGYLTERLPRGFTLARPEPRPIYLVQVGRGTLRGGDRNRTKGTIVSAGGQSAPATRPNGSQVSSKQIAHAAAGRRQVRFVTSIETVSGYVVGQDDYHWLVATITQQSDVEVVLVHKGSAALVKFTDRTLSQEPQTAVDRIEKVGVAFWGWCKKTYSI